MKKKYVIILLLFSIFSFSCGSNKNVIKPGFEHFKVSFEQDGLIKDIDTHEISLHKKPFSIIISFIGPDRIFINASYSAETFNAVKNSIELADIKGFEGTGIAEELFNKHEIIAISKVYPNFWYYANENDHRFSDVTERSGVFICRRKISAIIDSDRTKAKIDISKIKDNVVYFVFMKLDWDKDFSNRIEIKRDIVKVMFK